MLFHPRDGRGDLRLDAYERRRPRDEESPERALTRDYRARGWPEHRARAEARRLLAGAPAPGRGAARGEA